MKKITNEIKNKIYKLYKKAFPSKCYLCMGDHVPYKHFQTKREAQKFLFDNANKGYNAMILCAGTGLYRA